MPDVPVIDEDKLDQLGRRLFALWPTYKQDRRMLEERWLRCLRQFKGIYDPEVLGMIPADRSKAYPRLTAWLCKGTIARLMQIIFPSTEKNYGVKPSPLPDLTTEQLQTVLDQLVAERAQGGDPAQVALTDEEIEKAVLAFAKGKAERMEVKIDDDLAEMEYVTLIRRLVRSAVIYSSGTLKGPLHRKVKARSWQKNQYTGRYEAIEVDKFKPHFEFLPVWNYYPDLTAVSLDHQDGCFERHIMTRAQVEELAERPDFLGERVREYLRRNEHGNYTELWWEAAVKAEPRGATAGVMNKGTRKYEVLSYWGGVTGRDLAAAGSSVREEDLGRTFHANVWMIDDLVIKARIAPMDKVPHYHTFVFEEDDLSILGGSLPETLRDSQVSLCECVRAALDNMSVIGPMAGIDEEYLVPGQNKSIAKHKTWLFEGLPAGRSMQSVFANLSIDSHLGELVQMINLFLGFADKESGLPPPSMGDVSGGGSEALRTQRNASMFLGAAALPVRDTMRNYDIFTISAISALVKWNQKFDPSPTRDGDYDVIARGSTSLIAKEVLAQSLAEFRVTITPDELPHIKSRRLLIERAKANDIPVDELLEDEDVATANIQAQAQAQQSQLAAQEELVKAQVSEALASAFSKIAKAQADSAGANVAFAQLVLDSLAAGDEAAVQHEKNRIAASKPAAKGAK